MTGARTAGAAVSTAPAVTHVDALLESYEGVLLDAYGVLLDRSGPLPGASALVRRLNREGRPYLVLTNSASRLPHAMAEALAAMDLPVPGERVLTSGEVLASYFAEERLGGRRCVVLGTEDSGRFVQLAGGRVMAPDAAAPPEVVVLADQAGYPLLPTLDATLSAVLRAAQDSGAPRLVLCNPDLVYPTGNGAVGITAGALAALLEAVLAQRLPDLQPRFVPLGKPYPPIFREALRRLGTTRVVMVGDQLDTDVLGAHQAGIDSVLVATGLDRWPAPGGPGPTWLMAGLD